MTSPTDLPAAFDGVQYRNKYGQPESSSVSGAVVAVDQAARDAAAAAVQNWKPTTVYLSGQPVINPSGQLRTAKATFTSSSSYSESNWNDPLAGSYAALNAAAAYTYNADGTVATATENGVTAAYTYNADGTVHTVTASGVTRTVTYNANGTIAGVA